MQPKDPVPYWSGFGVQATRRMRWLRRCSTARRCLPSAAARRSRLWTSPPPPLAPSRRLQARMRPRQVCRALGQRALGHSLTWRTLRVPSNGGPADVQASWQQRPHGSRARAAIDGAALVQSCGARGCSSRRAS